MNKIFKWRVNSDALLLTSSPERKIFIKGKDNKILISSVKEFILNKEKNYTEYWLPIYEKDYLFKNIHNAFFHFQ